jgi:hypothetical protein
MTHIMPTILQATDWGTFLVHTGVIVPNIIFLIVLFIA